MRFLAALILSLAPPLLLAASSPQVQGEHVSVALLSEGDALVPGQPAWLGLRLTHDAHWHTYWMNPGDSGLPTTLTWQLPAGFTAGPIAWPAPQRFTLGELYNFGYSGQVLLPVRIDVPAAAAPGSTAQVSVQAKWLVCQEECIPGKATLALDLPLRAHALTDGAAAASFQAARAAQPLAATRRATAQLSGDEVTVRLLGFGLAGAEGLDAYAQNGKVVASAPPRVAPAGGDVVLTFAKSDYFTSIPKSLDLVLKPRSGPALRVQAAFAPSP